MQDGVQQQVVLLVPSLFVTSYVCYLKAHAQVEVWQGCLGSLPHQTPACQAAAYPAPPLLSNAAYQDMPCHFLWPHAVLC